MPRLSCGALRVLETALRNASYSPISLGSQDPGADGGADFATTSRKPTPP
jgi:hypothetical protein